MELSDGALTGFFEAVLPMLGERDRRQCCGLTAVFSLPPLPLASNPVDDWSRRVHQHDQPTLTEFYFYMVTLYTRYFLHVRKIGS